MARFCHDVETNGVLRGLDHHTRLSFEILTSGAFREALDLEWEDSHVRELYGRGSPKNVGDSGPMHNEQFLMARRLVELVSAV